MVLAGTVSAQDWPQWRGPGRDAKVSGFTAPETWPQELTQKWKVTVGDGVATPALVDGRLYVFARQGDEEVLSCLDADSGNELWKDSYETITVEGGPSRGFTGPRSSPTVADGKVLTFGVAGILSCYDASSGERLWRKDDFPGLWPQFYTSMSPVVSDGLCIGLFGGPETGAVVAYDLATGDQKWKTTTDSPDYASPVLMTVEGTQVVVTPTKGHMMALDVTDGKVLWQKPFAPDGRGLNAVTPVIDGQTVFYAGTGRGITAAKLSKADSGLAAEELWSNTDTSAEYNTAVLKNGLLFGLSQYGDFFCIDASTGDTRWTQGTDVREGYASVLDAGDVLLALRPQGRLLVLEPSGTEYRELARFQVADDGTYAHPVVAGSRIFIKDIDSVTLWALE
jgi:outer membrane protein assembly factor BamB